MNGKMQGGAFWEFRSRILREKRKKDTLHAMKNEKGEKVESSEEIKDVYKNYYHSLLNNLEEQEALESSSKVINEFNEIMNRGKIQVINSPGCVSSMIYYNPNPRCRYLQGKRKKSVMNIH